MAMTANRETVNEGRPAVQRFFRFGRKPVVAQSALLALLLGVFLLASAQVRAYAGNIQRDAFTISGAIPAPALRYTPPAGQRLPVVAVIAHGYSADKELMSAFALDLAKQGITVYTFDFPGHGASTATYGGLTRSNPVAGLVTTLGEVVDYALAHAPDPHTRVVLIGYSLGTIPVAKYAVEHPNMPNLAATVLVAGILTDRPTLSTPRNLLVLSGQFDLPGINDTARNTIASACGASAARVTAVYQCQAIPGDARKRVVLQGLDHISIVTAASTHAVTLTWLGKTVDPRIGKTPVNADTRLHWMLLGFLAALLAVGPIIALLSRLFRLQLATPPTLSLAQGRSADAATAAPPRWLGLAALPVALGVALLALRVALPSDFWAPDPFPFTFLRQQVSADVAIFFLFAGAALAALLWGVPRLRRAITLPSWREAAPQALIAAAVTGFLSLTLGALSTYAWESLTLEPQRLWRGAVYALMLWPFFFGLRSLLAALAPRLKRPVLADLGAGLLIVLALVVSIIMNFGRLSYLGILLPIVGIMIFLLAGMAAWSRRTLRYPVALVATLEALLMAWILSATLPLVS
ncbi:MAG TPA: alpha/beta fold hydrolase [Ktedonobacterales bacterium]